MKDYKNLFLSQSYLDAYDEFEKAVNSSAYAVWDYVVLTASNEKQANGYRLQIEKRLSEGQLPEKTKYLVIPDPEGKRVGSGGATFGVLKSVYEDMDEDSFAGKKILVIHSGGDSKRIPQYSACGKLFSPVPRILPNGKRSTLFDEFMISLSGVPMRIKDGMLVLSGDVLLLFNSLQLDFQGVGAAAISFKEDAEIGQHHGVFLGGDDGYVKRFLHKLSTEKLGEYGAVNTNGKVNIDTGAVVFSSEMLDDLYALIDTDEKFASYVNEKARLSFYADLLYPLASESTLEDYYKEIPEGDFTDELKECRTVIWDVLHKYSLKLISMSPARFIHFGTTEELLRLMNSEMDDFSFLGWDRRVLTNEDCGSTCASSNSYIAPTCTVPISAYIEDSVLLGNTKIGKNCVISGVTLTDEVIEDDTVIHGLKLENGKYVVRKYPVSLNPKVDDFWNKKVFCVADSYADSLHMKTDVMTSLCESFNNADIMDIIDSQDKIAEKVFVSNIISAVKSGIPADKLAKSISINEEIAEKILEASKDCDFSDKIRIYYYLSAFFPKYSEQNSKYQTMCFAEIGNVILKDSVSRLKIQDKLTPVKDEVNVELPIRVNWGGGWTDTPPYCNEHGGTVLNAALTLSGRCPVKVTVKKINENKIVFESADAGNYGEFTDIEDIRDCHNPFDPFALHKAALIATGTVSMENGTLSDVFAKIGSGLYLSTAVENIPRGSGLGTSSILAGACVMAIFDFFGIKVSDNELYSVVMCMEQIMSTGGGWQDQIGGILTGIKMIYSESGIRQDIVTEQVSLSDETKAELSERFALIYTGQRRLARNLLREVVGRYIANNPDSLFVLNEIRTVAEKMREKLEAGDINAFAKLLNSHWELSKRLDSGCTNTCIDQIFLSIEDLIDGKFICGAGGGGFLQVILKKGVTKEELRERLISVFDDSGVDVWESEFLF